MSSVMSLSCERIDASHFWLSDATTTSKDEWRKREYLEGLKNTVQHQLQMYHSQLRSVFPLISMMRSLNHWRKFRIPWCKFIKTRIIASAADHKTCYNWGKWKTWSWWMTWISASSYRWLQRNWNTTISKIWLCMNALTWLLCILKMSWSEGQRCLRCILRNLYSSSLQSKEEQKESIVSLLTYNTKLLY